jgi:protein TonB
MTKKLSFVLSATILLVTFIAHAQDAAQVGEAEGQKLILSRTPVAYPPMAKQLRLEGKVQVEVTLDETGKVESAKVVTGNAVLGGAALAAVKSWKFAPYKVDNTPKRSVVHCSIDFHL